jgi:hypothetical protein
MLKLLLLERWKRKIVSLLSRSLRDLQEIEKFSRMQNFILVTGSVYESKGSNSLPSNVWLIYKELFVSPK